MLNRDCKKPVYLKKIDGAKQNQLGDCHGDNKSWQTAPQLQLPLGDVRQFSSFLKTAPVTHQCF